MKHIALVFDDGKDERQVGIGKKFYTLYFASVQFIHSSGRDGIAFILRMCVHVMLEFISSLPLK